MPNLKGTDFPRSINGIVIAWWNTSLSPLGKRSANEKDRQVASSIVSFLINKLGVDCLALGEVTFEDLYFLIESCSSTDYNTFDGTLREGRLQFDTGLVYNKHLLEITDSKNIVSNYGRNSLKIAQRIDFITCETKEPLHLFISHWPSRLWCVENGAKRDLLGIRLRDATDKLKRDSLHSPQVIIVGDFNDEPFNKSLAGHLLASRDRTLVMKDDFFFYNPFWRHLGETFPYTPGVLSNSICGTYFHKSGEETKWRTFDQIIFSSSFLNNDRWYLNEEYTNIIHYPSFDELIRNTSEIFDHLPVVSVIQRRLDTFSKGADHGGFQVCI